MSGSGLELQRGKVMGAGELCSKLAGNVNEFPLKRELISVALCIS